MQLPDDKTFAGFYAGLNGQLVKLLQHAGIGEGPRFLYCWGASGSGRTHLLHATCAIATAMGEPSSYLPFSEYKKFTPDILESLEKLPLVCLDDLDAIAGLPEWEQALFNLFNRWLENDTGSLVVMGASAPRNLGLSLLDLASRLDWGLTYQLHELDDVQKSQH